ncbi:MAG: IS4 family transposase, partial [Bacteroidales bacterium]|nr:IS4 family transposase [Bacteroidales bacterium]
LFYFSLIYKGVSFVTYDNTCEILSDDVLNVLADESGFKKRDSKITPKMFLDNLLFNASSDVNKSLNSLSIEMKQAYGIDVTKQGLHDRFKESTTLYLKSILSKLSFQQVQSIDEGWMGYFNRVRIKDSTKFVLPEEYAEMMPGFGGVSSKSATCIQYEYDLKTGSILDLNITSANRPDSKDARDTQDNIKAGDLVIRDLGYYSTDVMKHLMDNGAFIISKLNTNTMVYETQDSQYEQIEFDKLFQWFTTHKIKQIEKQVYIGVESKLPFRLIISLVPEEVFDKRMQKINKYNKRMGYKTSDAYADRARFNLIITNVVSEIPPEVIMAIYHMRWQIELVFKIWKSTFGIHKTGQMKYYRWLSILYAKLILIVIYWHKILPLRTHFYKMKGKLLSIDKCFKTLKVFTVKLRKAIQYGEEKLESVTGEIQLLISEKHWLEKRKDKLNYEQIMYILFCKSNIYVYI